MISKIAVFLLNCEFPILDVFHIDQPKDIYRVKCANLDLRNSLVLKAKSLRDSDNYSNVFINRDLTYTQRQELYARQGTGGAGGDAGLGAGEVQPQTLNSDRPEQPDRTGGRPVASYTTAPLSGAAAVASMDPFVL